MNKKPNRIAKGLTASFPLFLLFTSHLSNFWIYLLCVLICLCLVYAFSEWITKSGLSVVERIGRAILLPVLCGLLAFGWGHLFWPSWSLDRSQRKGLAAAAKEVPRDIYVLVELPHDKLGQAYGEQIRKILDDNGVKVNHIRMLRGYGDDPVGVVVLAPVDGSPASRAGVFLQFNMAQFDIPATLEPAPPGGLTDDHSVIVLVGTKPRD